MRIKSAHIKDYRIHRDTRIDFADGITLVSGPNESGKSTLAEALRAGLFVKAKGAGALQRLGGEDSSVELELETKAGTVRLSKKFGSGAKTGTKLTLPGRSAIEDSDDAEKELARILGGEGPVQGRPRGIRDAREALSRSWGHLFVAQGSAGIEPLKEGDSVCGRLRVLLSAAGGGVSLSAADAKAAESVRTRAEALVDARSRGYKGSSEVGKAAAAREAAAKLRDAREADVRARADQADLADRLADAVARLDGEIKSVEGQIAEKNAILAKIDDLDRRIESVEQSSGPDREKAEGLAADVARLAEAKKSLVSLERELKPLQDVLDDAKTRLESARDEKRRLQEDLADKRKAAEAARRDLERLEAQREDEAARRELARAAGDKDRAEALDGTVRDEVRTRDAIPAVTDADVAKVDRLDGAAERERSALEALGVRITPRSGGKDVRVDGRVLAPGEEATFTEDVELDVDGTVVRIVLGGRTGLGKQREKVQKAEKDLRDALASFGCADLPALRELRRRRADAESAVRDAETARDSFVGTRTLEQLRKDAATAEARAKTAADALAGLGVAAATPSEAATLPARLKEAKDAVADKVSAEADCRGRLAAAETEESTQAEEVRKVADEMSGKEGRARELRSSVRTILEPWKNDEAALASAADDARSRLEKAEGTLGGLRTERDGLSPDAVRESLDALDGTLEQDRSRRDENRQRLSETRGLLKAGGDKDPNTLLREAEAELERAEERLAAEKRRADALRLLDETFATERKSIETNLAAPFVEKARRYLAPVFGSNVRLSVNNLADGEPEIVLERDRNDAFDALSGGASEQVATALRLAMAETLAADFDGHLPVVLDDAFANADPVRIGTIHQMIRLARDRGLQVILLTCDPARYAALGANQTVCLDRGAVV